MSSERNYTIIDYDIKQGDNEEKALKLLRKVFNENYDSNKLTTNTENTYNKARTLHLAVLDKEENVIAFNSFTPHNFNINGEKAVAYQMGWAAIEPEFRGKSIYKNIIEAAKVEVKKLGGEFLFGFPNTTSHPIFIHKLGFSDTWLSTCKIMLPNLFTKSKIHQNINVTQSDSVEIVEIEQFNFKAHYYPEKYFSIINGESFLWGRKQKKMGLPYFSLGGLQCKNSSEFLELIQQLSRQYFFTYIEIVSHPKNKYNSFFKKMSKTNSTQPFIVYDLQGNGFNAEQPFSFFSGLKDVF